MSLFKETLPLLQLQENSSHQIRIATRMTWAKVIVYANLYCSTEISYFSDFDVL